jgi:hypothetical protein
MVKSLAERLARGTRPTSIASVDPGSRLSLAPASEDR